MPSSSSTFTRPFMTLLLVLLGFGAIFGLVTLIIKPGSEAGKTLGTEVTLYFSHSEGDKISLVSTPRMLGDTLTGELLLQETTRELLAGPNHEESVAGLYSEIPKGTRLIDCIVHPDGIHLNLSRQFSSGGGSNSMRQRLAELSETVESLALEKAVILYIEGAAINVMGGEGLEVPGAKLSEGHNPTDSTS